ncbi:MAG TPA: hypothetical protein DIC46_10080 [Porphyromonadaceae bacterium]|jgi:glycosyltransferase involved in cell wall biosynthesis|nr:hypothetical protein [Porphyromonadaceae bacterium]
MIINKKNIAIISDSYPFGQTETFLENEIEFLSTYFNISVFPILKKNKDDVPRIVPKGVTFYAPIVQKNPFKRILKGIFNLSPIYLYIKELPKLWKESNDKKQSLLQWFLYLITYRSICSSPRFKDIWKIKDLEVVYFYWCNFPIRLLNTINNKKIYIRVHGGEVDLLRHKGYIPLLFYKLSNEYKYLPISQKSASLLSHGGITNMQLSRLGVYDHGLNPESNDSFIRIVSCSNLIPLKRVHLILMALKELKKEKVEWIHFGDGPLMNDLIQKSLYLPDNINVKFFGRIDNKLVIDFYKNNHVDLLINVSETEGIPVSIMEAFSFGIPCFATDVGGTSEIVKHNFNGFLAPKDFPINVLVNFISKIKSSSVEFEYRKNAKETWGNNYNAQNNYKDLVNLFLSMS